MFLVFPTWFLFSM